MKRKWVWVTGALLAVILATAATSKSASKISFLGRISDSCQCTDSPKYTGIVEDCCCDYETVDCVLVVFPNGSVDFSVNYESLSSVISECLSNLEWKGKPNSLSKEHVCWDVIYRTTEAVKKPLTTEDGFSVNPFQKSVLISEELYNGSKMREVIRKRRSVVDMDIGYVMERATFYQILLHCLPLGFRGEKKQGKQLALPFQVLPWDAEVHAVLFVHKVVGLPKGLYFLVRNEDHFDDLKRATKSDFEWEKPEGCPADLPLYTLARVISKYLPNNFHVISSSHNGYCPSSEYSWILNRNNI